MSLKHEQKKQLYSNIVEGMLMIVKGSEDFGQSVLVIIL